MDKFNKYIDYLIRYANSHATTPQIANTHVICREVGYNFGLSDAEMDGIFKEGER